ncbi:DUF935 domain-containing protein [Vibrio ruber]|uniref:DUF935 domain-containing protein n=1 Tax=Vibrio ruber TaxID=184755 RepID=UPI002893265F|nr:DUF935 domain-containing protein [Vibrio ruber]WNJ96548.1 DUF935 domain-containing protein [Vibrio ruber]
MNRIINPQTGKPFTTAERQALNHQQSKAYTTGVRTPTSSKSIATGLTPARLASILKNAINGSPEDYFILAEEMEERDLHYRAVISTRKLAVTSIEPVVEAASDESKDIEMADAVRHLLKHPNIPECAFDLLDGLGKGVGLVEIIWNTEQVPWKPKDYQWVDPRFIRLDRATYSEIRLANDKNWTEGEPLKPCGYICHQPRMKSGHWLRNGLARVVAVMYMLKSYTVRDWWAFAEIFGMPIRVGKYHSNASDEDIRTLVNAIATIASDAGAAIPESMQIDMIETAKGNGGETLFENMAEWADRQISKAVLGQTMTTDDGSSQSQATVHNDVRNDITRWDARQLANTFNEFLVKPFIDMNYGVQENYPVIKIEPEETEDTKTWVESLVPLIDRGMKVQMSDVRDRMKLSDPDKDAELLIPAGQLTPPNEFSLNHAWPLFNPGLNLALNRQERLNSEEELDEMTRQALDEWQEVSDPILSPILKLANESVSFDEFTTSLPKLAEELDAQVFIEQMAKLCWQARAMGDVQDG